MSEHLVRTVANTIAAAALHFNMTGRKPADLYEHIADALVSAQLIQSPETAAETERLRAELAKYVGKEPTIAEEMAYLSSCLDAVRDVCDDAEKQATRWEHPLPVPEWVAKVRSAADGLEPRRSYPPALPWAALMDDEDLSDFLDELAASAVTYDKSAALTEVEKTCGRWRAIAEAQHAHNTAPGPDAATGEGLTTEPAPTVQATQYAVNCLPEDGIDSHVFEITVEYRGRGRWAVKRHSQCLGSDGTWDYEMRPSSREDDWLATHRFDLDTALKLAKEQAPLVTVNGFTVADALRMAAQRAVEGGERS